MGARKPVATEKSSRPLGAVDIFSLELRDGTNDANPGRMDRNSARLGCSDACGKGQLRARPSFSPLGSLPQVVVMQTSDEWHLDDLSTLR